VVLALVTKHGNSIQYDTTKPCTMYNSLQHLIFPLTLHHLLTTSANIMVISVTEYADVIIICNCCLHIKSYKTLTIQITITKVYHCFQQNKYNTNK